MPSIVAYYVMPWHSASDEETIGCGMQRMVQGVEQLMDNIIWEVGTVYGVYCTMYAARYMIHETYVSNDRLSLCLMLCTRLINKHNGLVSLQEIPRLSGDRCFAWCPGLSLLRSCPGYMLASLGSCVFSSFEACLTWSGTCLAVTEACLTFLNSWNMCCIVHCSKHCSNHNYYV